MEILNKATRINLFSLKTPPMRAFHMTWFAFFLCFFGWFGIAPLMAIVREDLMLTKAQIGNTIIASVAITVLVRLLIGPLCDKFGSRFTYTWLLILGSLPGSVHQVSTRPYPARLPVVAYDSGVTVRRVRRTGEFKWRGRLIYLSAVLAKEPIGLVPCDNDCWEIRYSFHLLGVLNDRTHTITPALKWHQREPTV